MAARAGRCPQDSFIGTILATQTVLLAVRFPCLLQRTPQSIRTYGALCRTMTYLLSIMERTDEELVEVHAFLWDRYREVGVVEVRVDSQGRG